MKLKRIHAVVASTLALPMFLVACGGGGSSTDSTITTSVPATSTLSGTVPGTFIEAFCNDGSYYSTNSINDGTGQHPFTLEVPNGVDCRLVMTTNEDDAANKVISPLLFDDGSNNSGLINVQGDWEIGFVNLPMDYSLVSDASGDHVLDSPYSHTVQKTATVVIREVSYDPLDDDGDNIPDYYEDDDSDGSFNGEDADDDNDGTYDVDEVDYNDFDGDGIDDVYDRDDDNDGDHDLVDDDDDNDGIRDEDDDDHDDANETSDTTVYVPVTEYQLTQGRLLASQCAQCHGTNGRSVTSWDSIAGESAAELIEEMREIQAGEEDPIMQAQAHGYSDSEIEALAQWLATQPGGSDEDDD